MSTADRVRFMQQSDERCMQVIRLLQMSGKMTTDESNQVENFELHDGVLYRRVANRRLLVIPRSMRKGIVIGAHDYGGHFSVDCTVTKIMADYWLAGLVRYVRQHITMCLDCLTHKKPLGKVAGLLHPIPPGRRPFQIIHVDHLGSFETSTAKNKFLLVIVDNLTKYVQLYPCKTTDGGGVVRILTKFCDQRGIPDRIVSDRGTCFTSRKFEQFCQAKGINHTLKSPRHPQANGQVERANRIIIPLLSLSTDDQHRWDVKVGEVERHLNTAVNKTTTKTPFETLHGYKPRFHRIAWAELSSTRDDWVSPEELQQQVHGNILVAQQAAKANYDRKHSDGVKYDIGEVIVMSRPSTAGLNSKLQSKYREKPLQVLERLPNDTYRVEEITTGQQSTYSTTAHSSQLY